MSSFQQAIAAGLSQIRSAAGEEVTYSRGASGMTLVAVPGQSFGNRPAVGNTAHGIEVRNQDWLVKVSDLVLDGLAIEPRKGDTITRTLASGVIETYEMQPQASGCVWESSDRGGDTIRIHTKLVHNERE